MSDTERHFERMIRAEISRRQLLRRGAAGALSVSALSYLAACGSETGGGGDSKPESKVIEKGEVADSMYMANWPLYIEEDRGTLKEFQQKYGTKIKYVEEVNDNNEFFGKVRQQYDRGDSGGRDIHVVTDWMAGKMITLGYVQKLDHAALPNVQANLIDRLKSPPFDPKRDYSVPWQSGFGGIIYRKDKVKREPKSVDDLFDPDYKGKVTMLTEMRDTVGVVAAAMGFDPGDGHHGRVPAGDRQDRRGRRTRARSAASRATSTRKDITKGDSWIIIGWSGDAVQLEADNPNIKFVAPESGVHLWTDNMEIPVGAPEPFTAEKFMDFVYEPEVQADIAEYVNYICPGQRREGDPHRARPGARGEPADLPGRQDALGRVHLPAAEARRGHRADRGLPGRDRRLGP